MYVREAMRLYVNYYVFVSEHDRERKRERD